MKILLTGFEPFGGSDVNPSQQIVRSLSGRTVNGVELATALLPVDSVRGPAEAVLALHAHRPDVVLSLGQASGRPALNIERVALNLADYSIADNTGQKAVDQAVVAGGPAAYFVTVPLRAMLAAVKEANVPADLSLSAGTFLCNAVLYTVLHHIAVNGLPMRAGFIHVPALPEQAAARPSTPSMSLETMLIGVSAAIRALAAGSQAIDAPGQAIQYAGRSTQND